MDVLEKLIDGMRPAVVLVRMIEVRIDHFLTFHFILRIFTIECNLWPLTINLLLDNFKKVLLRTITGVLPCTQVDT